MHTSATSCCVGDGSQLVHGPTHQTASGKQATQIAVCNVMGIELPECQISSPLVPR